MTGSQPEVITDARLIGVVNREKIGGLRFDVVRSFSPGVAGQTLGLRVSVMQLGQAARVQEAVVDATDVPALMAAVARLAAETQNESEKAQTGPTAYRFGLLAIGVLLRDERRSFYVSAGDKPRASVALTIEELNQIGTLLGRAADKIRELEREHKKRLGTPG